ncbi:MAG: methylenetetrahydrofolate reductase C-terminal domain-containing protein [Deltaproteobacteria bacterium]|nr:methylenetetrahydrofolate reductase C-terminal domain-containing protein [Deltaproteobacteria bacterium]MBW2307559.1 methylenetetrahydrofolate reductase C-terminal domain-containing protein [Deltaproteobacteria bacterium]
MIVASRKPIEEIEAMIEPYRKLIILGCKECVTVCSAGGEKEVGILASELTISRKTRNMEIEIREHTLERQCDHEYIEQIADSVGEYEAILSMACGAGVQFVAEKYRSIPVMPAVNTTFLGVTEEQGVWTERCQACGTCILDRTGGICPVARCSKSLLNGPCGGSSSGKCEVNSDIDCGWQLIYDRLKDLGQLDKLEEVLPVKDWRTSRDGGPRKVVREDLRL